MVKAFKQFGDRIIEEEFSDMTWDLLPPHKNGWVAVDTKKMDDLIDVEVKEIMAETKIKKETVQKVSNEEDFSGYSLNKLKAMDLTQDQWEQILKNDKRKTVIDYAKTIVKE